MAFAWATAQAGTGTVSCTGTTTVTGTGTNFGAQGSAARLGGTIIVGGVTKTITAIASTTSLTTDTAFGTFTAQTYSCQNQVVQTGADTMGTNLGVITGFNVTNRGDQFRTFDCQGNDLTINGVLTVDSTTGQLRNNALTNFLKVISTGSASAELKINGQKSAAANAPFPYAGLDWLGTNGQKIMSLEGTATYPAKVTLTDACIRFGADWLTVYSLQFARITTQGDICWILNASGGGTSQGRLRLDNNTAVLDFQAKKTYMGVWLNFGVPQISLKGFTPVNTDGPEVNMASVSAAQLILVPDYDSTYVVPNYYAGSAWTNYGGSDIELEGNKKGTNFTWYSQSVSGATYNVMRFSKVIKAIGKDAAGNVLNGGYLYFQPVGANVAGIRPKGGTADITFDLSQKNIPVTGGSANTKFYFAWTYANTGGLKNTYSYFCSGTTPGAETHPAAMCFYGYDKQPVTLKLNDNGTFEFTTNHANLPTSDKVAANAAAITDATINFSTKTLTVTASSNSQRTYDQFQVKLRGEPVNFPLNDDCAVVNGRTYYVGWSMVVNAGVTYTAHANLPEIAYAAITNSGTITGITNWSGASPFVTTGAGSVLDLNRATLNWAPAAYADQIRIGSGGTLNITNGTSFTVSPTLGLGYGTAATAMFRSGSTLNMSDSTVVYNIVSGGSGTFFSNSEANSTWNISNSTLTLNCPNNAQVAIHAYFKPESVINGLTVNGTASNVVWQMGYTSNNSKMVGFKYGGSIYGNGTSNCLMDTYTYTGSLTVIPSNFGSSNKWWWVDVEMQAGGLFRWSTGSTPTGNSGFFGVLCFRPVIKTEKVGYAPKLRITPSAMSARYPVKTITTRAESTVALSEFFRDPTFMSASDGFLPFVDSLDDKTVINTINWTLDFRQNGWLGQTATFMAATAKKGLVTYSASGAVDSNYINDTTGAADAALIAVNEATKELSAVTGTLTWSAQRMYNALINKWSSFAIEQNIVSGSTGGKLDLADYTVDVSISFVRGSVTDLLSEVKTTGVIESQTNQIPVADVNGSRASISGTDPQGFGVTWFLRWKKTSGGSWTNASGTGNTTQIVVDQDTYTVQARVPGYDWKTVEFDTTLSLSLDLNLSYQVSANNTPQYTMTYDAELEAIFQYDATAMKVSVVNSTSGILSPGFAELYRATQRIQHIPALVWSWTAPVTANATSQKILIPSGNPISMFLTDASTNTVKITCPVIHADTGQSADDRVRGNASGYSIILGSPATAESAGLASQIISGLGGPGYDTSEHGLSVIEELVQQVKTLNTAIKGRTDLIPDAPAAVGSAMTLTSAYDAAKTAATQTSVDAVNSGLNTLSTDLDTLDQLVQSLPTLPEIEASTALAKAANVAAVPAAVRTELATELARIDVAVSTRSTLTPGDIPAGLTAAQVRTELTPELARIDVAVSTRSTLTAADIPAGLTATEVWTADTRTLTEATGLTTGQAEQLRKVAQLHGVGAQLVVTETTRTAGDVSQTLTTDDDGNTTVSAA